MLPLARLCCVVLMLIGLAFFVGDLAGVVKNGYSWTSLMLWRWGFGAMAAGALVGALLGIGQAMVASAQQPSDAKGE